MRARIQVCPRTEAVRPLRMLNVRTRRKGLRETAAWTGPVCGPALASGCDAGWGRPCRHGARPWGVVWTWGPGRKGAVGPALRGRAGAGTLLSQWSRGACLRLSELRRRGSGVLLESLLSASLVPVPALPT